ncbi:MULTISPECIES: DUF3047 domain-containing protein [Hyphomicrobiales]|uniref:DUF3047 domain-containing protein n=1 Tax=Xanthobacter autotrophicus TaxID=280 RepID=UPI00372BA0A1
MKPALKLLGLSGMLAALAQGAAAQDRVEVGRFSNGTVAGWESRSFKGETAYTVITDPDIKAPALRAVADASASGRFRKIKVDLNRTPFLNWSWKVSNSFPDIDERTKAGDDFAARLYVVVERGIMGMGSLSLNYVWANRQATGSLWPSPYSGQVQLLALDSGAKDLGQWVHHKRDLRADLRQAFGEDIPAIDAVALMTDTDNHGGRAEALYGDIWFSED